MKVQQALEQIKQYIDLGEYTRYVELVLEELYLGGKADEMIDSLARGHELLTEEQLIEREKVSDSVTSLESVIL